MQYDRSIDTVDPRSRSEPLLFSRDLMVFGISEKIGCGLAMANKWSDPPVQIMMSFAFGVPGIIAAMVMVAVYLSIFAVPLVWVALFAYYQYVFIATPPADCEKYITFKARHPNLLRKAPTATGWTRANAPAARAHNPSPSPKP